MTPRSPLVFHGGKAPRLDAAGRIRSRVETAPFALVRERDGWVLAFAHDVHDVTRTAHALWSGARVHPGDLPRAVTVGADHVGTIARTRDLDRSAYEEPHMRPVTRTAAQRPTLTEAPAPTPRVAVAHPPHVEVSLTVPAPPPVHVSAPPADEAHVAAPALTDRFVSLRLAADTHARVLGLIDREVRRGAIARPTSVDVLRAAIARGLDALEAAT